MFRSYECVLSILDTLLSALIEKYLKACNHRLREKVLVSHDFLNRQCACKLFRKNAVIYTKENPTRYSQSTFAWPNAPSRGSRKEDFSKTKLVITIKLFTIIIKNVHARIDVFKSKISLNVLMQEAWCIFLDTSVFYLLVRHAGGRHGETQENRQADETVNYDGLSL